MSVIQELFLKLDEMINNVFDIDGKIIQLVDWFLEFPALIKIPALFLLIFILYLGVFQFIKKVVFGLPKKVFLFIVFVLGLYLFFTYIVTK